MGTDLYRLLNRLSRSPVIHAALPPARAIAKWPLLLILPLFLGRVTYFKAGTITNKSCDFQKDPKFVEAYAAAMRQQYMPDTDTWRYHINHWAISHALKLEGDLVECGVYRGSIAMSNIAYVGQEALKDRKYYLFDTFDGLDKALSTEDEYSRLKDAYPDCFEFVVESFKEYPNVVVVKGSVPGTLSRVPIEKVSYLSIDMNCALAEEAALEHFWPLLVSGGVIVLDDYGWPTCEGQKEAADAFARSVGTAVMCLPNGQGVIVK